MKIAIYLSETTKNKLEENKRLYKISISTMAQVLTDIIRPLKNKYENSFFTEYLDKEHRNKTYIKPNNAKENSEFFNSIKNDSKIASHIYSNILYWYANKKYNLIFNTTNEKDIKKWSKELEKEFYKKKEIYWNYNDSLRNQVKIVKKNQQYFKQILGIQ